MSVQTLKAVILSSLLISMVLATKGVDTQFLVSVDQMKCVKQTTDNGELKSYFVILRAWNGDNTFVNSTRQSLINAKAAGVNASQVMLYVQPCGK